ncbi:Uncharacterised protein [Orientia tsutsugamushi str. Gilliam]|uniref:Uncharacterized protein n=1 Tax=Orientia tsutsugamushi str. Gilliam TaxID=1359184 RepID=A0A2U3QZU8_ORITS|nr:Uncharacterised protein [Orientia tsutsugamushi str. Gilliam]
MKQKRDSCEQQKEWYYERANIIAGYVNNKSIANIAKIVLLYY